MSGIRKAMLAVAMAVGAVGPTALTAQIQPPPQLPRVGDRVRIRAPSIREDRYVGTRRSAAAGFDPAGHGRR